MPAPAEDVAGPQVTLRYWAAAKQAAGTAQDLLGPAGTLADLLDLARAAHPDGGRLASVLSRCSFLVDGEPVGLRGHDQVPLPAGAVVEALPPFAGG